MKPIKLYSGDTLPIWNYWMINKTGELKYIAESCELSSFEPERKKQLGLIAEAWEEIQETLNEVFIQDPDYVSALIEEKDYLYKVIDASVNPNALNNFKLKVAKREKEDSKDFDYETSIAILEKYLGYSINDREMSAKRYYTHLRLMKKANKPSIKPNE